MNHTVYIGIGSNIGDRNAYIETSLQELSTIGKITTSSSIIETPAWGIENLPDFLNLVIELQTPLFPIELMSAILQIEEKIGRKRAKKWDSRVIDIDILFFDNWFFETPDLIIPHPFIADRMFVLEPMKELNGDFMHPKVLKTVNDLYHQLKNK